MGGLVAASAIKIILGEVLTLKWGVGISYVIAEITIIEIKRNHS